MKTHVDNLLTRERILAFVLVAASALVLWLCWLLTQPFVPALTWAVVLAVIAHPLHERILVKLSSWPNAAAALAVIAVTLVIALPTAYLAREVVNEAIASADAVHSLVDGERWRKAMDRFPRLAPLKQFIDSEIDVKGQVAQASGGVAKNVQSVLASGVEFGVTLMVTFFLLFFFLRDKWRILDTIQRLMPLAAPEAAQLERKLRDMIGAVVYGTLVVALVQGALGGVMFWWLGLPAPLMWGAMMALLAVLPFLGAAIVWLPAVGFLLLDGQWEKALLLFLWGSLVIGLIDNFLYPLLMKNRVQMHTVPVFIGAMGGIFAFGATGIVLGPLILAVAIALIDIWRHRMMLHEVVTGVNDNAPR
ncbi:MAG: AI-2E family transporter [Burkholderiales bacterium]